MSDENKQNKRRHVAVVGGGAAGMMAAWAAAEEGARVTLFEKNEKTGKKLFITGKGRCNVCSATEVPEWFDKVRHNPRFLYSAIYGFDNYALMALLEKEGVALKEERGQRIFPASDKSSDVLRALLRMMRKEGVKLQLHHRVEDIWQEDSCCKGIIVGGEKLAFDAVILATGGASYAATGSTGDGYPMAKRTGHRLVSIEPSLIPMETRETWPKELPGLALRNVELRVYQHGKERYREMGEMLCAHYGVTGPLILSASAFCEGSEDIQLAIDLKPALDLAQLEARLQREFDANAKKEWQNILPELMPRNMAAALAPSCPIPEGKICADIKKEERAALAQFLKGIPLHVTNFRPLNDAIITRGGVDVRDVDPSTMASKRCQGLYFAGELLDVDAQTGGYNLQIAFSTGMLAGKSAAAGDGMTSQQ